MPLPIVHNPNYNAEMPAGHRFPMGKFLGVANALRLQGLVASSGFHEPAPAPASWVSLAHQRAYVDQVFSADVPKKIAREVGFPMTKSVGLRARCATGGTVLTARLALEHGLACNTAGGSHHARAEQGAGFCVFNDVAVASRVLQAEGQAQKVLVVDLDVHQGDGTASIFADDDSVFTFSMHAEKNYPVRKVASNMDIGLPDQTADKDYLAQLRDVLPGLIADTAPDIIFYNAGVDPHQDDRLGRLSLSDAGLEERDHLVIGLARDNHIPLAGVLGGGYSRDIEALAQRHTTLHRVASQFVS
ncbi:MAG: histone deacetylase [Stappiaceae bacterium]